MCIAHSHTHGRRLRKRILYPCLFPASLYDTHNTDIQLKIQRVVRLHLERDVAATEQYAGGGEKEGAEACDDEGD